MKTLCISSLVVRSQLLYFYIYFLRYNLHMMKCLNLNVKLEEFYLCINIGKHHPYQDTEHLYYPRRFLHTPSQLVPAFLLCRSSTILTCTTIDYFCFLQTSYEWDCILCTFLCMASFTHNDFEIHICCCVYQQFILFIAVCYSSIWIYNDLFIHSLTDGYLDCFQFGIFWINLLWIFL